MFIRVKSTPNSPRRSVQVVQSVRLGDRVSQRIVRHMGIALDADEEAKLRLMAQEFITRCEVDALNADSLFSVDGVAPRAPGRPKRQTLESVAPPEDVRLGDLVEVARHVEGPHEVFGSLFDQLHFDQVLPGRYGAVLRDLVIARIMDPDSKRASTAQLQLHYGRTHSLDSVYRLMDSLHERLDALKQIVLDATRSLTGGSVQMMLFDVTTLYFESVDADELRAFGYSKDQKYHCTQVVLALATNEDGLPIGYELFAGNTAEVKTLLACMQRWRETLSVDKVSFVADRALCSRANLSALEAAPWQYVVAMPLRRSLGEAQQAMVLNTALAAPLELDGELVWTREFEWEGRRLIVSYSSRRAHKDRKRGFKALLTWPRAGQMSTTCRSSAKPTRQVVPSPGSIEAVRWLMRTMVPTTVFRCLSSKATFSPQRKSLRLARGADGGCGAGCGLAAPGAGGSTAV